MGYKERIAALRGSQDAGAGPWRSAFPGIRFRTVSVRQAIGTGYRGEIEVSYDKLVKAFGLPYNRQQDGDGKITTEWVLQIGTEIATIYDWKKDLPAEKVTRWNIGGLGDPEMLTQAVVSIIIDKNKLGPADVPYYFQQRQGAGAIVVPGKDYPAAQRRRTTKPRLSR